MRELPNVRNARRLSIDIETKDVNLKKHGSGVRTDGRIVGLAIATEDNQWYLPFDHETKEEQYDKDVIIRWAKENFSNPSQPKIFANGLYDLDYLAQYGVPVAGCLYDVQNAEPLLDENLRSYSLESLGQRYVGSGKFEGELEAYTQSNFGKRAKAKENIWQIPPSLVTKYAEEDARLTFDVFQKQEILLKQQGLWELFQLETDLVPMLLAMKRRGVRIDTQRAQTLDVEFDQRLEQLENELLLLTMSEVNVHASASIAAACDTLNITYPRTAKTNAPSFTKGWMEKQDHPLFKLILEIRKYKKFKDTFINSAILGHTHDGRIHCQFNQLRSDEYGTVSGRFSSSNPNLQQIPSRDGELAKSIRGLFLPDEGDTWFKFDYKAIEPRVSIHYAAEENRNYRGAAEAARFLRENPGVDVYQPMIDKLPNLSRSVIKMVYLGVSYSMGVNKLSKTLGMDEHTARNTISEFNANVPYLKLLSDDCTATANRTGEITTLLGRKRHFDMWEEKWGNREEGKFIKGTVEDARRHFGDKGVNFQRAFCYKAFNSLIQGSSADIMKKAMVDVWRSGVCEVLGPPLLTVHDELDFSVPNTTEGREAALEVKRIMENTIKLHVPLEVDMEIGKSWGEVK